MDDREAGVSMSLRWKIAILLGILVFFSWGCAKKPGFVKEGKYIHENRWRVAELNVSKLSEDEAATYREFGPPDYIRFFTVLRPHREWRAGWLKKGIEVTVGRPFRKQGEKRPVEVWVYEEEEMLVTFLEGKHIDYVAVSD